VELEMVPQILLPTKVELVVELVVQEVLRQPALLEGQDLLLQLTALLSTELEAVAVEEVQVALDLLTLLLALLLVEQNIKTQEMPLITQEVVLAVEEWEMLWAVMEDLV
jgi:hypothetical protein